METREAEGIFSKSVLPCSGAMRRRYLIPIGCVLHNLNLPFTRAWNLTIGPQGIGISSLGQLAVLMNLCLNQYEKPKRDAMIKAAVKHAYSNESEWERLRDLNCHAVESLEQLMRDQATEEEDSEGGDATNDGSDDDDDDDDDETIWMRGEERTRFDAPKLMPKCLRSRWGRSGRAAKSVQEFWPVWHAVFEGILGSESSEHLVCTYANEALRLMSLFPLTNPTPDGAENDTNSSNATGTDGDDSNASKKPVPSLYALAMFVNTFCTEFWTPYFSGI